MQHPLSPLKLAFRIALLILLALFVGAVGAMAQIVTPKSVPVFRGLQGAPSQRERERRSHADFALYRERPSHPVRQVPADRQA